ncbi:MAG: ribose 5-phosphate isomerase B [Nitrospiraceae bacterium]|nr:ribose 5-phosphate isomerase B [Nitrospiraceae bacterium]
MKLAIGADHGGVNLKGGIIELLKSKGHEVTDFGAYRLEPEDDYPDFAARVAGAVRSGQAERGILICGSGVGASVAANKFKGIRAAVCHDCFSAHQGVEDDDMNVICLGARIIGEEAAREVVERFVGARFSGAPRHLRRLNKVREMEKEFG